MTIDEYILQHIDDEGDYLLSPQHRRLKLKVIKDGEEYPYDIDQDGNYITYPLTLGSGQYEIRGYENIEGSRYAVLFIHFSQKSI